ncbi:serine dehydratase subunit alpha family protein [Psychromonas aquimarina]|uniref:L-cysteine desulfidase family protein n=1 Tax=Psychromonas aquimarina TaxID=444919 RepID=UPI00041EE4DE|nr:L-serine ammonia-lyase, iron-sulfur-dependent, subunit alpha [Psychromonas aquimarina]
MKKEWQQYIDIIKRVVKPALGCTEPIAAAYASAVAVRELGNKIPDSIEVFVSSNLYKNSMGVFVPGTGRIGLPIAAAAGAVNGKAEAELEVLSGISMDDVDKAQALIDAGKVIVRRVDCDEFIYCSVAVSLDDMRSEVTISGGHTNIVKKTLNDVITFEAHLEDVQTTASVCDGVDIDIEKIYDFAVKAEFNDISFILEAAVINEMLSAEGIKSGYGLEIGRTMKADIEEGFLSEDLMTRIQMLTSAASDARMGGAALPAMSNFGSGNQGIAATIPVCVAADHFDSSEEQLARALIMSHLGAIYIKSHYPPLSAFCGNTVTSAAAGMALVYLAGGTFEQSCYAIQNVISDSAGMVCDGAKSSCAMKVCTSSTTAVRSFMMALRNNCAAGQGIVAKEVEQTVKNVGKMVSKGMCGTDTAIIDIMSA